MAVFKLWKSSHGVIGMFVGTGGVVWLVSTGFWLFDIISSKKEELL